MQLSQQYWQLQDTQRYHSWPTNTYVSHFCSSQNNTNPYWSVQEVTSRRSSIFKSIKTKQKLITNISFPFLLSSLASNQEEDGTSLTQSISGYPHVTVRYKTPWANKNTIKETFFRVKLWAPCIHYSKCICVHFFRKVGEDKLQFSHRNVGYDGLIRNRCAQSHTETTRGTSGGKAGRKKRTEVAARQLILYHVSL